MNNYHVFVERRSEIKKERSTIQFNTPLTLEEILTNMLKEDSINNAENTMIKLEITNLKYDK